ncbi:COP9 signalosome complex subunit 5 [Frankliniella fusca]|uniref:COP9 signalosome complex subunit 5 n=1 Tax=Frankliniella fusca TaxID=407009 RepID=A0AAE1LB02_9NEOP|nr:COP9 signalosome complex subunit 5 [Frankliniella fusca]
MEHYHDRLRAPLEVQQGRREESPAVAGCSPAPSPEPPYQVACSRSLLRLWLQQQRGQPAASRVGTKPYECLYITADAARPGPISVRADRSADAERTGAGQRHTGRPRVATSAAPPHRYHGATSLPPVGE